MNSAWERFKTASGYSRCSLVDAVKWDNDAMIQDAINENMPDELGVELFGISCSIKDNIKVPKLLFGKFRIACLSMRDLDINHAVYGAVGKKNLKLVIFLFEVFDPTIFDKHTLLGRACLNLHVSMVRFLYDKFKLQKVVVIHKLQELWRLYKEKRSEHNFKLLLQEFDLTEDDMDKYYPPPVSHTCETESEATWPKAATRNPGSVDHHSHLREQTAEGFSYVDFVNNKFKLLNNDTKDYTIPIESVRQVFQTYTSGGIIPAPLLW